MFQDVLLVLFGMCVAYFLMTLSLLVKSLRAKREQPILGVPANCYAVKPVEGCPCCSPRHGATQLCDACRWTELVQHAYEE